VKVYQEVEGGGMIRKTLLKTNRPARLSFVFLEMFTFFWHPSSPAALPSS
jgi:hypothetical protein